MAASFMVVVLLVVFLFIPTGIALCMSGRSSFELPNDKACYQQ